MAEAWAPGLADVGRHIPQRTRDTKTPGRDVLLGTFTASTTPTADQAQQVIDDAVAGLLAEFGELPVNADQSPEIAVAARTAAEWQAAADIEIAYPQRSADITVYDQLSARAVQARRALSAALTVVGAGPADLLPYWSMPAPPPWADTSPGSGTSYVTGSS